MLRGLWKLIVQYEVPTQLYYSLQLRCYYINEKVLKALCSILCSFPLCFCVLTIVVE